MTTPRSRRSVRLDQIRSCYIREIRPQLAKAIDRKKLSIVDSLVSDQGLHGDRIADVVGRAKLSQLLWTKCRRTEEVYAFVERCRAYETDWSKTRWHDDKEEAEAHMQRVYKKLRQRINQASN